MVKRKVNLTLLTIIVSGFLLGGSLFISGCSCNDANIASFQGTLATNLPGDRLLFSNIEAGKEYVQSFKLYNTGTGELEVVDLKIVSTNNQSKKVFSIAKKPNLPFILAPGKGNAVTISIKFFAKEAGIFSARLQIKAPEASNSDEEGYYYVELLNQRLTPDPNFICGDGKQVNVLDFGAVEKGDKKVMTCKLQNLGTAALVIKGVKFEQEQKNKPVDFKWLEPNNFPIKLEPSDQKFITVKIQYAPSDFPPAEDIGYFVLDSNYPKDQGTPSLKVIGKTAVALIKVIPKHGICKQRAECLQLDKRLSCSYKENGKTYCVPSESVPPFLKFPLTSKKKTSRLKVIIVSAGERPLQVKGIEFDSASSPDFQVDTANLKLPFTLDPKQQKEITVTYTPTDDQPDTGTLIISSNAGDAPKLSIKVSASSRGCNIDVNPRSHKFLSPQPITVTIVNVGNESCKLHKVSLKDGSTNAFSLLPVPRPQTIAPNGKVDFLVNFTPPAKQSYKDVILIETSDPDEPIIEVPLEGEITNTEACELEAKPSKLSFGLVGLGRSKKLMVQLSNNGWGDCNIKDLRVVGTNPQNNNAFSLVTKVPLPFKLRKGNDIRLEVAFTPPQELPGYEGELQIVNDSKKNPNFSIKLSGSSGTLCLEVIPQSMDFGSSKFGCATPTRKIQVFNLGAANCQKSITITGIKLGQGTTKEFRIMTAPPTPKTLNTGESIEIGMSYKPKQLGVDTGTLEIENDVPGQSPVTVPLVGEGIDSDEQKDVFKQLSRPLTDIMFVVDDSCSMADNQANLAKNFKHFINWAVRLNVDYQIMVTTTDVQSRRYLPGCARGSVKIITPTTPNPVGTFERNVKVGTSGSATEKGLEAAYKALTPPASTSASCNKGFNRKEASLSIIFVSDEKDQSSKPVQFYVSFFKSLKGYRNLDKIRASSIVGPPPSGCRGAGGSADSAPRYWQVATELKGIKASICSKNWGATLSNIGSITFGYRSQFFLSRQADPKTLKVKVNGTPVPEDPNDGWQYDPTNNSITFSKTQIPPPGATIEIQYKAICLP